MEVNKDKIRYILQFLFDKGKKATRAAEIVNDVYGPGTVTARYVQFWFRRFRSGNFDIKDSPRSGRPVAESVNKITEIVKTDGHVSTRSIAQELNISHKTVLRYLHKAGFSKKLDVWVPSELKPKKKRDQVSIRESSAKHDDIDSSLKTCVRLEAQGSHSPKEEHSAAPSIYPTQSENTIEM